MNRFRWAAPLIALAILAACDESSSPLPRQAPSLSHLTGYSACDATLAAQIYADIDLIFSGAQRSKARKAFGDVESKCATSTMAVARRNMMTYVQYTISQKSKINSSLGTQLQRYQALADDWDKVFVYVGYAAPSDALPTGTQMGLALTDNGAAAVFRDGKLLTATLWAGLQAGAASTGGPYAGDPSQRLWLIVPITCPASLGLEPLCYDLSVHPTDLLNSQTVIAALCPANNGAGDHLRLELAHEFDEPTAAIKTKIPKRASVANFGLDCDTAPVATLDGDSTWWQLASRERSLVGRVVDGVSDFLTPASAYALHGGLGGTTDTRSGFLGGTPFGGVDPLVLSDDFENDTPGQPPFRPDVGEIPTDSTMPKPWSITLASPSSVTVQSSYADIASRVMVIDQKGGACSTCDSLTVYARVRGAAPNKGRVSIRWQSVTASPNISSAPIFIRSFDGTEVVARVDYGRGANAQSGPILLNGSLTGVTWTRNVSQYFEVIVDLDTDAVELRVNSGGWSANGSPTATTTTTASNVGRFGVEMGGQDNGLIGMDRITIRRLPDAQ